MRYHGIMTLVRRIARPLIAVPLLEDGIDAVRHPGPRAEAAGPLVHSLAPTLRLPDDPELLVRANGALRSVAAALFALGRMPRVTSLLLAVSLVPATYVNHPFWKEQDAARRKEQQRLFAKNLGLVGATLIASVDTEGRPGLAYRTRRAGKDAKRAAKLAKAEARRSAHRASKDVSRGAHSASREAKLAATKAHKATPFS